MANARQAALELAKVVRYGKVSDVVPAIEAVLAQEHGWLARAFSETTGETLEESWKVFADLEARR